MKIWDTRKKRCIHTYKGHTRRIDVLKFTPDGRWIVSGGADNSVKIWDLTAGKLLHDFNLHEGPVNCLDFHPHEFLLATGSADKTIKFWDLETFELIGSSGPENSREYFVTAAVVRSMKFNSDGKKLLCGLHESLKVLSWEPIICHDVIDVGWSILEDITVNEGKLLGCSYNQSCVGVWVVDLMRTESYADTSTGSHLTGNVRGPIQSDNSMSSVFGRLSISRSQASGISSGTLLERSMSGSKEIPVSSSALKKGSPKQPGKKDLQLIRSDSVPLLSPRIRLNTNFLDDQKRRPAAAMPLPAPRLRTKVDLSSDAVMLSRNIHASASPTPRSRSKISAYDSKESSCMPNFIPRRTSKMDAGPILSEAAMGKLPVIEPQNMEKGGLVANHGKEDGKFAPVIESRSPKMDLEVDCRGITDDEEYKKVSPGTTLRVNLGFDHRRAENQKVHERMFQSKPISSQRKFIRETSGPGDNSCSGSVCTGNVYSNEVGSWYDVSSCDKQNFAALRNPEFANNRNGLIRFSQLVESGGKHAVEHRPSSSYYDSIQSEPTSGLSRLHPSDAGEQSVSISNEGAMAVLENHQDFIHIMKSRKIKLEAVYQFWQGNDITGFLDATWRTLDCAVTADIISVLMENSNCITLDTCSFLLRLAASLFESTYDRHLSIALEMVLKLVKTFGATISSTLLATPPVGIDLEAELRLERCHLCFQELKKVSANLMPLTRRRGKVGRSAQELSLFLQDIFQLPSV